MTPEERDVRRIGEPEAQAAPPRPPARRATLAEDEERRLLGEIEEAVFAIRFRPVPGCRARLSTAIAAADLAGIPRAARDAATRRGRERADRAFLAWLNAEWKGQA